MNQLCSLLKIERNIPIEIHPELRDEPSQKGLIKSMPMPTTSGTYNCQYFVLGAQLPVWTTFQVDENKESKIISQTSELQKPTQLKKNRIKRIHKNKAQSLLKSYELMPESDLDYISGLDTFLTQNKEITNEQFIEEKLEEYECKIELFKQNKKTKKFEGKTNLIPYIGRSENKFYIRYNGHSKMKEVVLLQLKQKNQEPIIIFFPQMEWSPFFVVSVKKKKNKEWEETIKVDWIFPEEAALALAYFQEMKLYQVELIRNFIMGNNSDNKPKLNTKDPLTLVCFGYLFLKMSFVQDVEKIRDQLIKNFNWLPDSFIIHATLLKREGKFTRAIKTLIKGFSKGPPISSMGLDFTQEILGPIYTPGYPKLSQPTIDIVHKFYKKLIYLKPLLINQNYSLGLTMAESKFNNLLEDLDKNDLGKSRETETREMAII